MKFAVLALDYDGTIAVDDRLDPQVKAAVLDLRRRGIVVLLVTGRILSDLRRVAGDLSFVDGVVAENGAVLALLGGRRTTTLGPPPPPQFLDALALQGVEAQAGACVVEADARDAERIVAIIRRLELPLAPIFNRSRVMILPQGISKATGLHMALRLFRLSEHNAIAIGDAENDHVLLDASEIGVAVGWGSPVLQAVADAVIPGDGPRAVARYLRTLGERPRLPQDHGRRSLLLGHSSNGEAVSLRVRGRNVLIAGDSGSGKSWVAGLLCEQLILQRYSVCIIDPEGDYRGLDALPGVVVLGGVATPPPMTEIALALRHPDLSVVVNLSKVERGAKCAYVTSLLPQIAVLRRRTGLPHRIVLDEAHTFLHGEAAATLLDPDLDGYTLITYRLSELDPSVRAAHPVVVATRLTDPNDIRLVREFSAGEGDLQEWATLLGRLEVGEAALLPPTEEAHGQVRRVRLQARVTAHVRHREKYVDVAVPEPSAFVFTRAGASIGVQARTMRELARHVREVDPDVLLGHLVRGDFSRWIRDVFADEELAARIRVLERLHRYEALSDVRAAVARLIEKRYVLMDELS